MDGHLCLRLFLVWDDQKLKGSRDEEKEMNEKTHTL